MQVQTLQVGTPSIDVPPQPHNTLAHLPAAECLSNMSVGGTQVIYSRGPLLWQGWQSPGKLVNIQNEVRSSARPGQHTLQPDDAHCGQQAYWCTTARTCLRWLPSSRPAAHLHDCCCRTCRRLRTSDLMAARWSTRRRSSARKFL